MMPSMRVRPVRCSVECAACRASFPRPAPSPARVHSRFLNIPFGRTKAERLASGDPRLSLEERYGTHDGYVARVRAAAKGLAEQRLLLQEDADRLIEQATNSRVLR